jgi:hypothetical protein
MDEDAMAGDLVQALRAHSLDFITAAEAGTAGLPDEEHLEYATAHGLVVYSFNIKDFYKLHNDSLERGLSHAGIILCRQRAYSIGEQLRRILNLVDTLSAEDMQNRVEFLSSWG